MLETILKDIDNKHMIITLLEYLINEKINDFEYVGIQKFNSIMEYNFSLIKIKLLLSKNRQKIIYLRMIKGGMIKKSIFCYWSLIYEEFLNKNKYNKEFIMPHKVLIEEKSIEQNRKDVILNINKNSNYSTEIALVELREYIIEKSRKDKSLKKLLNYLDKNNKDILFLGII